MPETFRIVRELLSRVDDPATGACCDDIQTQIPARAHKEAERMAKLSGNSMLSNYKVCQGVKYIS